MRRYLAAAALSVSMIAVTLSSASAANPGGISGFVRDAAGSPVPFATVAVVGTAFGRELHADRNGYFIDMNLEPGFYSLVVPGGSDQFGGCGVANVFADESSRVVIVLNLKGTIECRGVRGSLVDAGATGDVYRI